MEKLYFAFKNSLNGLKRALREERAIRQEIFLLVIAVPLAFLIAPSLFHTFLLIISILFILSIELLNTCIEKLCDHVTPEHHEAIGYIKDLGSAAVLCALICAVLLWGYNFALLLGF